MAIILIFWKFLVATSFRGILTNGHYQRKFNTLMKTQPFCVCENQVVRKLCFSTAALPLLEVIISSPTLSICIGDSGWDSYHSTAGAHHKKTLAFSNY